MYALFFKRVNRGILPQQTRQISMYTSLFKRARQYDAFKVKEKRQIYMYTSFFKREWQNNAFIAKQNKVYQPGATATTNNAKLHVYLVL